MSKAIKTTVYLPVEVYVPEDSSIASLIELHNIPIDKFQKMALSSLYGIEEITKGIQDALDFGCRSIKTGKIEPHLTRYTLVTKDRV